MPFTVEPLNSVPEAPVSDGRAWKPTIGASTQVSLAGGSAAALSGVPSHCRATQPDGGSQVSEV